jgi:hypothetical protein
VLTIDRFHAAYHVPHGTPEPEVLRGRLDRMVRERLPGAIGSARGEPEGDDVFYVIHRLHLNLWVDALSMEDGDVAERWGRLLAGGVARAILYGGDNVRRYGGAADYLAAFLGDLVAGQAWTQWEYEQFRPLEDLAVGEAAVHLLSGRPALMLRVAERLQSNGQLDRLTAALGERDAELLWRDGLGFGSVAGRPLPENVEVILRGPMPSVRLAGGAAFARVRLAAYLQLSIAGRHNEPDGSLAVIAHGLARLRQLMDARPAPHVWEALAGGEIESPAALAAFLGAVPARAAPARDWLIEQLSAPAGSAKVARLVQALRPGSGVEEAPVPDGRARAEVVASAFAGLALLVPAIREAGVFEHGGRDAVYQLLIDAAGPEYASLAADDLGLRLLAGIEPADAERARRKDLKWPEIDREARGTTDDARSAGYLPVTLAVLGGFARRLRGFEASSPEYIDRQFLRLPGHFELGDEALNVTLHQAPLGMVLQMSGLTGTQGPVPWLDGRRLVVDLPSGST